MDCNNGSALEFVGFKLGNSGLVIHNQFQQEQQEKDQTFLKFVLALRTLLMPSISKDLLWTEWATIRPNKDCKHMGVQRFARALGDIQRKLIDKQGRKSITDEVKIMKFLNNIPDIIKKSITAHLTDDVTYNHIVRKSEQFEAVNRGSNADHTNLGYHSNVSRYPNATCTRSSSRTQQPRPDKGPPHQNGLATLGATSTAPGGTKDLNRDDIQKTLYEKERVRRAREKLCLWYELAGHNCKECMKRLYK